MKKKEERNDEMERQNWKRTKGEDTKKNRKRNYKRNKEKEKETAMKRTDERKGRGESCENHFSGPVERLSHEPPHPLNGPVSSCAAMSACLVWLQVSGPEDWDKATINCTAVQRTRETKSPTCCPCPRTRPETNGTGLAQNGVIRPVSLNTFTYLRVLSARGFVLAQEEGRAWMEGREEEGTRGVSAFVCVHVFSGEKASREDGKWTHEINDRFPQWWLELWKHQSIVRDGEEAFVCVLPPREDRSLNVAFCSVPFGLHSPFFCLIQPFLKSCFF